MCDSSSSCSSTGGDNNQIRCDINNTYVPNDSCQSNLICICSDKSPRSDGSITVSITNRKQSIRYFTFGMVIVSTVWNIMTEYQQLPQFLFTHEALPVATLEPEGWSDVKLLVYMTTHLPPQHVAFFPCWKDAFERLTIFKYADLMMYTSTEPTNEQLELLPFQNTTIKIYTNTGYQSGAVQAMVDPFLHNGESGLISTIG